MLLSLHHSDITGLETYQDICLSDGSSILIDSSASSSSYSDLSILRSRQVIKGLKKLPQRLEIFAARMLASNHPKECLDSNGSLLPCRDPSQKLARANLSLCFVHSYGQQGTPAENLSEDQWYAQVVVCGCMWLLCTFSRLKVDVVVLMPR